MSCWWLPRAWQPACCCGKWAKVVVMIDAKPSIGLIIATTIEAWPKLPGFTEQIPEKKPPHTSCRQPWTPRPPGALPGRRTMGFYPAHQQSAPRFGPEFTAGHRHTTVSVSPPASPPAHPSTSRGPRRFSSSQKPLSALASVRSPRRTETRAAKTAGQDGGLRNMAEASPPGA